jgi:tetratricopeptide (TPR) repeat protein
MSSTPSRPLNTPVARRRRRRVLLGLSLSAGLLALLLATWFVWRRPAAPAAPAAPAIPVTGVDPELVAAIEAARARVRKEPSADAWGELGKLFRDCKFVEQAAACFAEAERVEPADARWPYLRGEALRLHDPDAALPHLRHAVELADQGKDRAAAGRMRRRLAETLLATGGYDEAEGHLRRALEDDPADPTTHLGLGLLAYARDDLDEGRAQLLLCLDSPFTQKRACAQLAVLEQRRGDPAAAEEYSRRARTLPPDTPWPDPLTAVSLRTLIGKPVRFTFLDRLRREHRYAEAVYLLQQMAAEDPDYRVYAGLGENLAHLGRWQEAERALRLAVREAPDNVNANYLLGKLLFTRAEQLWNQPGGRDQAVAQFRAAAECARRAVAGKPDDAASHVLLGRSLKYLGERPQALDSLRRAVECGPEDADAHLYLGEALAEEGREAEARAELEQAVTLAGPDDPRPRQALERLGATGKKPGG